VATQGPRFDWLRFQFHWLAHKKTGPAKGRLS